VSGRPWLQYDKSFGVMDSTKQLDADFYFLIASI
jgi:hypothetical protein